MECLLLDDRLLLLLPDSGFLLEFNFFFPGLDLEPDLEESLEEPDDADECLFLYFLGDGDLDDSADLQGFGSCYSRHLCFTAVFLTCFI